MFLLLVCIRRAYIVLLKNTKKKKKALGSKFQAKNNEKVSLPDWRRQWQPTPVLLPGKSRGRRSLVGFSPWGREDSDTTERLPFHFSLSCTAEGNCNPLQRSCLENPRDRGAWWAAIYGVAQSRTRLKRLSSSSSRHLVPTEKQTELQLLLSQ